MSEEVTALTEQRDVLLQSLRDLEQERAAGEIGDEDYTVLKDDYTARAAAVLRAIEAAQRTAGSRRPRTRPAGAPPRRPPGVRPAGARGVARRPPARLRAANRPVGRRQRTLAISLVVVFVLVAVPVVAVVLLADGRTPGAPVTGSVPDSSVAGGATVDDALALETDGKAVEALQLYDQILAAEPDNVEALAYRGWLLKRAGLADEALESLDRAVTLDPTFADAHFFRGMVLFQDRDDPAGAVLEFEAFLANDPPPDFVDAVREVLANAQAAAAAKASGGTTATTVASSPPPG